MLGQTGKSIDTSGIAGFWITGSYTNLPVTVLSRVVRTIGKAVLYLVGLRYIGDHYNEENCTISAIVLYHRQLIY